MISLERRLQQAEEIFGQYELGKPFGLFLKQFFKAHKKYGSRDRKEISRVLFSVLRSSILAKNESFNNQALIGLYLQGYTVDNFPENRNFQEKIEFLSSKFSIIYHCLPLNGEISSALEISNIERQLFLISPVFFRLYGEQKHLNELQKLNIDYEEVARLCFRAPANSKLSETIAYKKGAVDIQDYSSQQIVDFFEAERDEKWWDCCCGSGGKSALFLQKFKNTNLYCSDNRKGILKNLDNRLSRLNLKPKSIFKRDLIHDQIKNSEKYDGIIADVPCTGSGTFSRNPEQMLGMNSTKLKEYSRRQFDLVLNASKTLKPNGSLVYITCSIYKRENELQIEKMQKEIGFELEKAQYIYSPNYQSDQLFIAHLTKS